MLDCQQKKRSTVKSTYTTSFVPRQLLLSSSSSKSRMGQQEKENCRNTTVSLTPQDRVFLLQIICQFLDLNGFRKTLKKFRSEADIEEDDWENCSVNLVEMFQEHLRMRNDADKRTKENQVEDGKKSEATSENETVNGDNVKPKKKKKTKTVDSADPVEDTLSEPAKAVKKSKKNKQKDLSEPSDEDLKEQPVADTLSVPSQPVKKSKDKKKKHKDELEVLDKDLQEGKTSGKPDDVSLEEKKEKSKSKKVKEDLSISKDEVDEDGKRSKKRKKSSSDDHATGYDEDDSKRRKIDDSDKSNGAAQPPKTPKGTANGFVEKDGEEKAHKEDTTKETNGSVEPTSAKAFQRVKAEEVKFVDDRLKDNSYWAKDGADSGYGAKAQEVLGQVRGRDFRHEKTKKKRGTYRDRKSVV